MKILQLVLVGRYLLFLNYAQCHFISVWKLWFSFSLQLILEALFLDTQQLVVIATLYAIYIDSSSWNPDTVL